MYKKEKAKRISGICAVLIVLLLITLGCTPKETKKENTSNDELPNELPADPIYTSCATADSGFKYETMNVLIDDLTRVNTITEEIEVQNRNAWWFLLGPLGTIPYLLETHKDVMVVDTYISKTYKICEVTNATIWSGMPAQYMGDSLQLSLQKENITQESVGQSYRANLQFSLGVDYIITAQLSTGFENEISTVKTKIESLSQGVTYNLSTYEPRLYYRIAIKGNYSVFKTIVKNEEGEIISEIKYIAYDDTSFYQRLECSLSQTF